MVNTLRTFPSLAPLSFQSCRGPRFTSPLFVPALLHSSRVPLPDFSPKSIAARRASRIHPCAECVSNLSTLALPARLWPPLSRPRQFPFSSAQASHLPCPPRRNTIPPAYASRCSSRSLFQDP